MYPWHGPNNHTSNAPPPGPHGPPPAQPSSSPSFAVHQHQPLRWLPAVVSRPQNTQPAAVSSSLRHMGLVRNPDHGHHQHQHQHQHQPPPPPGVNMTVENRPESVESSDMEQSDSSPGNNNGRDATAAAMGSHSYVRNTTDPGAVGPLSNSLMRPGVGGRPSISEMEVDGSVTGGGGEDSGSRKHGKRLTTKEEVTLFDICNRHAHEFGQRSNLCKWWATVTDEFTRAHGHPYSWHSVRRKVETVTKQRMKFLEEHREKGGVSEDLSNPQWRATIDAWIPTWKRWEESEARRIEKRDSRKSRKRKSRSWEAFDSVSDGWSQSASPAVPAAAAPMGPPSSAASTTTTPAVRLPPGFESMFPNPPPQTPTSRTGGFPPSSQNPYQASPSSSTPGGFDGHVMTAMLDTLNKLNKRLDSAPAAAPAAANPRASPVISALVSTTESPSQPSPNQIQEDSGAPVSASQDVISITKLKEELRQEILTEVRQELEKDRAGLEEKLDSVQRTQDMILEMLRQEPT